MIIVPPTAGLAISNETQDIKPLIANFEMLILHFALILSG